MAASASVREQIRKVLLEVWDPIGVKDEPNAQDEYDAYISGVYGLLVHGASEAVIRQHLFEIAHDRMGFEDAMAWNTRNVVAALQAIRLHES